MSQTRVICRWYFTNLDNLWVILGYKLSVKECFPINKAAEQFPPGTLPSFHYLGVNIAQEGVDMKLESIQIIILFTFYTYFKWYCEMYITVWQKVHWMLLNMISLILNK